MKMEIISPNKWQNKSLSEDEIAKSVKNRAEAVCKNREDLAKELGKVLSNVEEQKKRIDSIVTNILNILDKLPLREDEAIRNCCKALLSKYYDYENDIRVLEKRFQNKKIRVISFGDKSQGKSSFTKAYTGLPDSVVAVKSPTDNIDKTGATNVIIHKDGVSVENPEIFVVLKKKDSILEAVNKCLGELSKYGLTIKGKIKFTSWEELYEILEDEKEKAKIKKEIDDFNPPAENKDPVFLAMRTMLSNVFMEKSDFSEVNKTGGTSDYYTKGKKIGLESLPMYNDMQFKGNQRYITVSEIRIFVDLQHEGMFENIEICDTKGFSVRAGGDMWKSDLYKEIGNSDAAFSIQMVGQKGNSDVNFYGGLSKECKNYPKELADLRLKHYALLNILNGINSNNFENELKEIKEFDIYNTIYAGALTEDAIFDETPLDMKEFVNYVIYDMMIKVVKSTQKTDNNLMKRINDYPEEIRKLRKDLQSSLSCVDNFETKDWDAYIKEIIIEKIPIVVKDLNGFADKNGVVHKNLDGEGNGINDESKKAKWRVRNPQNNTPQNAVETYAKEDLSDDESNNDTPEACTGVYNMITNKKESKKYNNYDDAIKGAVTKVCDDVYDDYVKNNPGAGTASNIGAFIDDVSLKVFNRIRDNVNKYVEISINGKIDEFRNGLFRIIWKGFGLNKFYSDENNFKAEWLEDTRPNLIKDWHTQYNDIIGLSGAEAIFPRLSYSVLRYYFKDAEPLSEEKNRNFEIVVEKTRLEDAFVNAYRCHNFEDRYRQCTKTNAGKRSVHSAVTAGLLDKKDFAVKLLSLYKLLSPNEYVNKLCESDMINDEKKNEFENQKLMNELKEAYSNLISLSF